jgi:hypothetical protein
VYEVYHTVKMPSAIQELPLLVIASLAETIN